MPPDPAERDAALVLDMALAAQDALGFVADLDDRLIHGYAEVRLDVVWAVIKDRLPALLAALAPCLPTVAAIAAAFSFWAAYTARQIGKDAVAATKQQTEIAAVHDLLDHYAGPEMYRALRLYGQFVAEDAGHRARSGRITKRAMANGFPQDSEGDEDDDLTWAIDAMNRDQVLGEARRRIHHHFKRVWALRRADILSYRTLLTSAQSGWSLWRDEVLPVTLALGDRHREDGRHPVAARDWANELLEWVDQADGSQGS